MKCKKKGMNVSNSMNVATKISTYRALRSYWAADMNAGELLDLTSMPTLPVEMKYLLNMFPWLSGATAALWKEITEISDLLITCIS